MYGTGVGRLEFSIVLKGAVKVYRRRKESRPGEVGFMDEAVTLLAAALK